MAQVISVSALNTYVRSILESDEALGDIAVEGEISNFSRNYKTGHCYFSLKDAKAAVRAVMFRSDAERLAFMPENGMQLVVRGRATLYERDGAFQLYAEFLFPKGQGAAQMAFDQLKAKLEKDGLLAPELKQPLPPWPKNIGLVTSKTGAALQDILNVAARRCPFARFTLVPVTVQGQAAAGQISAAIRWLDVQPEVDVIMVARGGGSAEDLAVFNDEGIARTVFGCATPVISAIGHEVDYTILDFVADVRAPTPSAAAELALPDAAGALAGMMNVFTNITNNMQFKMNSWYNELDGVMRNTALAKVATAIDIKRSELAKTAREITHAGRQSLQRGHTALGHVVALAAGLNPYAVLARGYAMAKGPNGLLGSAKQAAPGDEVQVVLHDGVLGCTVDTIQEGPVRLDGE